MTKLSIIVLLFIGGTLYSQKLKDRLEGDWVCTKILDTEGNATSGKFGDSNDYLKFSFQSENLSITKSPYDRGIKIPVKYKDNVVYLYPQLSIDFPESKYKVRLLSETHLILTTENLNWETIAYHFIKQAQLVPEVTPGVQLIDNLLIIIKHFKVSKDARQTLRVSDYEISNDSVNLYQSPLFDASGSDGFGNYFTTNFEFPKTYPLGTLSEELIVDFDVDSKGADNIKLVKGLSGDLNNAVIKLITKSRKKWKPVKINNKPIKTTLRLHFLFYLGPMNLKVRSKSGTEQ